MDPAKHIGSYLRPIDEDEAQVAIELIYVKDFMNPTESWALIVMLAGAQE